MSGSDTLLVLSTLAYREQAAAVCAAGGFEAGTVEEKQFPDGERYVRLSCEVTGRDVVVVGGTVDDVSLMELYDIGCTAVDCGARRLSLMIPYFGYSTMERAVKTGEAVTAKHRARVLSSIPPAAYHNRVFMVDLHSEGIPHYFGSRIRATHVYAKSLVIEAAKRLGGDEDFVMACTDAGRAKWVESLANDIGVDACFVFKRRLDGDHTEVTAVSAQVQDKVVIIYDDMIRTGGSLIGAAQAYRDAGARRISAVTTHGVFPNDAVQRIYDSGLFDTVVCTDSHPNALRAREEHPDFLEVVSLTGVLIDALRSHP